MIKFLDLEKITEKNFEEIKTVVTKTISSTNFKLYLLHIFLILSV